MVQVIVHAATHASLEDRLSAHVLYFCLGDIASGQQLQQQQLAEGDSWQLQKGGSGVQQLLSRYIGQLARDLNLLLRRRQGPGPGLHTLLR